MTMQEYMRSKFKSVKMRTLFSCLTALRNLTNRAWIGRSLKGLPTTHWTRRHWFRTQDPLLRKAWMTDQICKTCSITTFLNPRNLTTRRGAHSLKRRGPQFREVRMMTRTLVQGGLAQKFHRSQSPWYRIATIRLKPSFRRPSRKWETQFARINQRWPLHSFKACQRIRWSPHGHSRILVKMRRRNKPPCLLLQRPLIIKRDRSLPRLPLWGAPKMLSSQSSFLESWSLKILTKRCQAPNWLRHKESESLSKIFLKRRENFHLPLSKSKRTKDTRKRMQSWTKFFRTNNSKSQAICLRPPPRWNHLRKFQASADRTRNENTN